MDAKKCNLIETLYTLYKTFISSLSRFLLQNGKGSSRGLRFFWGVREEGEDKPISVMKLICNIHMKKKVQIKKNKNSVILVEIQFILILWVSVQISSDLVLQFRTANNHSTLALFDCCIPGTWKYVVYWKLFDNKHSG